MQDDKNRFELWSIKEEDMQLGQQRRINFIKYWR